MMDRKKIRVSVRGLVERVLMQGDLGFGSPSLAVLMDGSAAHRSYQHQQDASYEAEVPIQAMFEGDYVTLQLQGRIDGIAHEESGLILEEIKSTHMDLSLVGEGLAEHWAQAWIYGAILAEQRDLSGMGIRLVYIHIPSGEIRCFSQQASREDLEQRLQDYLIPYLKREDALAHHEFNRDQSLAAMEFCFPQYRAGQRSMAADVFRTVRDRSAAMIEAPTGIGKTASALFGALKAMSQGYMQKLFYLCSRTTIKQIAEDTLDKFCTGNRPLRRITLTAKMNCCPRGEAACHVQDCPYALGFFDRLPEALEHAMGLYRLDREAIASLAESYRLCPFELSLNLAELCDVIICDYNYAFDPRVRLQRFFQDGGPYTLLIDEAHQLVDRARSMFSASIARSDVRKLREVLPKGKLTGELKQLRTVTQAIYAAFRALESQMEERNSLALDAPFEALSLACHDFCEAAAPMLTQEHTPWHGAMADLYFICRNYVAADKAFDEHYRFLAERTGKSATEATLLCLDPSGRLQQSYRKCGSVLMFSATLSPAGYYQRLLGLQDHPVRSLPSPFDPDHLRVLVREDLSTAYRHRQNNYDEVAESIYAFILGKEGHYMAFFPSYAYLQEVQTRFRDKHPDIPLWVQESGMEEQARTAYLDGFHRDTDRMLLGFVVMGGFFAEGIDLAGDSLIGAILVGVGLPQIGPQRDLIRSYHEDLGEDGFAYAYQYPGFNRVLQAAGRVIRTQEDRGMLLLIDPRFVREDYRALMPYAWFPLTAIRSTGEISRESRAFWQLA